MTSKAKTSDWTALSRSIDVIDKEVGKRDREGEGQKRGGEQRVFKAVGQTEQEGEDKNVITITDRSCTM